MDDFLRNQIGHRLFQNVFGRLPAQFQSSRDRLDEFDQFVIQQRHARFYGMRHAHAIHFGQNVAGQIRFAVQVKQPLNLIGRTRFGKQVFKRRRRIMSV